jgi:hypothetical protein
MRNSRLFILLFFALFIIFISACDRTGRVQPIPGTAITFSKIHSTSVTVGWGAATDKAIPAANLSYKLVRSISDNLDSLTDVETNGTVVMDWTTNTLTYTVIGLSASTTYYFAVLVKDATGNKALYTQQSLTTGTPEWTWMLGSTTTGQPGVYGMKGTASPTNIPGARMGSALWTDSEGNVWLFGGDGYDSNGNMDDLGDLWKFDGTNWTWVWGSNVKTKSATYGVKGVTNPANAPGGRLAPAYWKDSSGNFWFFGGYGWYDSGQFAQDVMNDLWKFDGTNWTWFAGSGSGGSIAGNYGAKGVANGANVPPARYWAHSWTDSTGNFWLFGGMGLSDYYNDLWKFDGTNWTWVTGSNTVNQAGTYGTQGVAASGNVPGARNGASYWKDSSGNFWVFGGQGYDSAGTSDFLNDLWKFDGTNWTWVGGSKLVDQAGTYGTQGVAASTNIPSARAGAAVWTDSEGNLWLFGGWKNPDFYSDLWKFNGTNWTWVGGSNTTNQAGIYGILGVAAAQNLPGSRATGMAWTDTMDQLWLFGGWGYGSIIGAPDLLNDLWKYTP